jgi:predicted ATP-grasp superfamily ATP-dependent carboligase
MISEFLVGGAAAIHASTTSMRVEGMAMLQAITKDVSQIPGCSVVTTLSARLSNTLGCEVILIEDPRQESVVFQSMLTQVDAALIIAPESNGVLAKRCRQVRSAGIASWNCNPSSIELCADKLLLAEHLQRNGLPTIPTRTADLDFQPEDDRWPVVLKPVDGAGSSLTFLVQNRDQWKDAIQTIRESRDATQFVVQPFIAGRPLSAGLNLSFDGKCIECLTIGEQRLSDDRRFRYRGGFLPADISQTTRDHIEELALAACRTVPGLAGYVGMDFILTDQGFPMIVEINPRLTTAYVGYRERYSASIPERWLSSSEKPLAQFQKLEPVEFYFDKC